MASPGSAKAAAILLASIALGSLWGHGLAVWPLAPVILLPVVWSWAGQRWLAGLVPALYVLAATRGLIAGSEAFFARGSVFAVLLWLAAALPLWLVGMLCWHPRHLRRVVVGIPVLCLAWLLPPVMLVGWAHPLLAAGWWLPGMGIWALPLALVLLMLFAAFARHPATPVLLVLIIGQALWRHPSPAINRHADIAAHHTAFAIGTAGSPLPDRQTLLKRHWYMQAMLDDAPNARIHVFPESVAGFWDDYLAMQWQGFLARAHPGKTVLLGAYRREGERPEGVVVAVNASTSRVVYVQRLPMTGGMVNPFGDRHEHFVSHWFGQSHGELVGRHGVMRAGFALCFEHVVLWPMLQTTLTRPDVVIAPASIWWAPLSLQNAQRQSLRLWALWLDVPVIESLNGAIP